MGSIYLCGSEEQKQRWLPAMARMEKIGAFALTEPDVGSGVAGGLTTTAQRDGDIWVLNGEKKWIGNATFADYVIVWARDVADNQVKGFVVESGHARASPRRRCATRSRCGSCRTREITLDNVRVPGGEQAAAGRLVPRHREGAAADQGRRGLAGDGLRARRLRARAGLREQAAPVRPADRRVPARPGPAGADAVQRHRVGLPVPAAIPAARPGPGQGSPLGHGQGVLHGADARDRRLRTRAARRQRHPAGATRSAGSWPTPRRSTPTRAPARSIP